MNTRISINHLIAINSLTLAGLGILTNPFNIIDNTYRQGWLSILVAKALVLELLLTCEQLQRLKCWKLPANPNFVAVNEGCSQFQPVKKLQGP
jgi:hypothetical protein